MRLVLRLGCTIGLLGRAVRGLRRTIRRRAILGLGCAELGLRGAVLRLDRVLGLRYVFPWPRLVPGRAGMEGWQRRHAIGGVVGAAAVPVLVVGFV